MSRCLVLVGAARSGTKLLRDLIAAHPTVDRVPYDVNYIWRLGNDSVPHDELGVELATPRVGSRIRRHILKFGRGAPWLVEKTVSNTLRVDFVDAVFPFPDARYVHLVRDGRDVAESAYRQWTAPPDWGDIVRKLPAFPLSMIGGYGMRYAAAALRRAVGSVAVRAAPVWGPAYRDIQRDLATRPLLDVCALQWQASVLRAFEAFDRMDENRVLLLRYEDLVRDPASEVGRIWQWMGLETGASPSPSPSPGGWAHATASNIGRGGLAVDPEAGARIEGLMARGLARCGYTVTPNRAL